MTTNCEILERLFREGGIRLVRGAIFDQIRRRCRRTLIFPRSRG
jgi:hypothetical protein